MEIMACWNQYFHKDHLEKKKVWRFIAYDFIG